MKNEPLKGKVTYYKYGTAIVWVKDLRSAVEGLKKEFEKHLVFTKELNGAIDKWLKCWDD